MRILGIDPGLQITGYGVVEKINSDLKVIEAGTIKTDAKAPLQVRLNTIYSQLIELIDDTNPQICVLENLYSHYKHPMTSILMGHARGVIALTASVKSIELINYPAKTVKRSVTGNGNASKMQVKFVVERLLDIDTKDHPVDITDALALCLTHFRHLNSKIESFLV